MMRIKGLVLAAMVCAAGAGAGASSALAANTLGPPPWKGALCPAIGLDTGCQYGVDVTAVDAGNIATQQSIAEDGDQTTYDDVEDATIVVKNDAAAPLSSLPMGIAGSGQDLFGFDGDGLCTGAANGSVTWTPPAGCAVSAYPAPPSDPTPYTLSGYEGPGVWFGADPTHRYNDFNAPGYAIPDAGSVNFNPALAPGQTAYFSLETNPNVVPTVGPVNNWITSQMTAPSQTAGSYIAVPSATDVTDQATINGAHGALSGGVTGDGTAAGTVIYKLFANDNSCSAAPVYTSPAEPVTAGIAAPSGAVGASLPAGRYYWLEDYSGDGLNSPAQSICGQEILDVGATGVINHLSAATVAPGTAVTDTATLAAAVPQALSGTVSFAIFTDPACKVAYSGTPGTFTGLTPANAAATSPAIVLPPGTYYWVASYSGDTTAGKIKNAAGASPCGASVLQVANSSFSSSLKAKVSKGFRLVFSVTVTNPGKFSWTFATPNRHQVFTARISTAQTARRHGKRPKRCGKGKMRYGKKCVPVLIGYGRGSRSVGPGTFNVTVKPSGLVLRALKHGWTLKLSGQMTFQSAYGGPSVTKRLKLTVHGVKCSKKRAGQHLCVRHG